MSGTIGYDELRVATVRQVAQLMAAAAITAPESGGQLFLAGKPNFLETVIADDPATPRQLAAGTQPTGVPGAARHGGARKCQAPRQPIRHSQP